MNNYKGGKGGIPLPPILSTVLYEDISVQMRAAIIENARYRLIPGVLCALLNVGVVGDVVLAVAEIAVAPGAVPKLQFRICNIRPSANGTFVPEVRRFRGFVQRDRAGLLGLLLGRFIATLAFPGLGDEVADVPAHKQKIVTQGNQWEQIVGEEHYRIA